MPFLRYFLTTVSHFFLKEFVNFIIYSIIVECQLSSLYFLNFCMTDLVKPSFESSLYPTLDFKGKGLSSVWTLAYNWPIWGSVSDPCPWLACSRDQEEGSRRQTTGSRQQLNQTLSIWLGIQFRQHCCQIKERRSFFFK